jgi:adenylate kinase family enzyme
MLEGGGDLRVSALQPKIHIVGAPSAGKSTLARQLADRLGCPHYDLDPIAFVDERWTLRPMGERLALVDQIVRQPAWIAEGGHLGWTEPLLAAADAIVWLDPPLRVLLYRHWVRHRERGLWWLIRYGWTWQVRWYFQSYQHDLAPGTDPIPSRASTAAAINSYARKTQRYRADGSLDALEQALRGLQR